MVGWTPTRLDRHPGWGSASAVAAALGSAPAGHDGQDARKAEPDMAGRLGHSAEETDRLRAALVEQERTDAGVYERMVATVRASSHRGRPRGGQAAEAARADATEVPLATAELAAEALGLAGELAGMGLA